MLALLRSRARPRCLVAMAMLAWLMLAVAPLGARPHMAPVQQASTAIHASHTTIIIGTTACCDEHAGHPDRHASLACPCALPCAGVLPVAQLGLAALPTLPARYAAPPSTQAPLSGFAPPLRPPRA